MDKIKLLLIFVLLSCAKEEIHYAKRVNISNANPIQFWLTGDESFNQKEICGINPTCYCQPWNCGDKIVTQLTDTDSSKYYELRAYDVNSNLLWYRQFSRHVVNKLYPISPALQFTNYNFQGSLSPWGQRLSYTSWSFISNGLIRCNSSNQFSKQLYQSRPNDALGLGWPPGNYTINFIGTNNSTGTFPDLFNFQISGSDDLSSFTSIVFTDPIDVTSFNVSVSFSTSKYWKYFGIFGQVPIGDTFKCDLNSISITAAPTQDVVFNYILFDNSFTPSNEGLCSSNQLVLPPSSWTMISGSYASRTATSFIDAGSGSASRLAYIPAVLNPGNAFRLSLRLNLNSGSVTISVRLTDSSNIQLSGSSSYTYTQSTPGSYDLNINYANTSAQSSARLQLQIQNTASAFDFSVDLNNVGDNVDYSYSPSKQVQFKIFDSTTSPHTEVAFSDCIDLADSHDCTNLIQYSNSSDFAGLNFNNESPQLYFYLRIPSVFFEEDYPQEQEDLELSNDTIVTLWNKTERKRLLEIGYMPFYMHQKLAFVLQMDTLIIDGTRWRKRDPYQWVSPQSRRYALRKANVLLSDQDFIDRNLL